MDNLNTTQIQAWIQTAKPDELLQVGKLTVARIGTLDASYTDRFVKDIRGDGQTSRIFDKLNV